MKSDGTMGSLCWGSEPWLLLVCLPSSFCKRFLAPCFPAIWCLGPGLCLICSSPSLSCDYYTYPPWGPGMGKGKIRIRCALPGVSRWSTAAASLGVSRLSTAAASLSWAGGAEVYSPACDSVDVWVGAKGQRFAPCPSGYQAQPNMEAAYPWRGHMSTRS